MTNIVELKNTYREENIAEFIAEVRETLLEIEKDPGGVDCLVFAASLKDGYKSTWFGGWENIIGLLEWMKISKLLKTFYKVNEGE